MTKWLKLGGALLLLAWAPFLYGELTSSPAEQRTRELPSAVADEPQIVPAEPEREPAAALPAEAAQPGAPAAVEEGDEEQGGPELGAPADEPPADEEAAALAVAFEPGELEPPPEANREGDEAERHADEPEVEAQQDDVPPPVASGPTALFRDAFETQPRDALWATDAEARIAALFGTPEVPQDMLQAASCRKAVCKLDLRWTRQHAVAYVTVYQSITDQFGPEVAVEPIGVPDEAGGQQVHLYLPRKGYTVADFSQ